MYTNNTETSLLKKTVLARGDLEGLYDTNLYHLSTLGEAGKGSSNCACKIK